MNINSLLNDKADDGNAHSTSAASRPSLPPLSTRTPSASQQGQSDGYPFPQTAQSYRATTPPHGQSRHSSHQTQTPLSAPSPGPYAYPPQQPQYVQSPYAQPVMTPGGHYGHAPQIRQPSQTPSSIHEQTPISQHRSPISPYAQPRHSQPMLQTQQSFQQSYPNTPLGPPPSRGSLPATRESPHPLQRRSSGASHASFGSQGPPPPLASPQQLTYPQHQHQHRHSVGQQSMPSQRPVSSGETNGHRASRSHSISVSPKTVVAGLPHHNSTNAVETPAHPHQYQQQQQQQQQQDTQSIRNSVVDNSTTVSKPQSLDQALRHPALSHPPPLPTNNSSSLHAPHAPQPSGMSSESSFATTESTPVPQPATKRGREVSPKPAAPPAKRRRVVKPPPVWALPAKSAKPNWKGSKATGRPPVQHQQQPNPQSVATNGGPKMVAASHVATGKTVGPLGPWEPCFTNVIPFEAVTREISNFLWATVVKDQSTGTGDAGGVPSSLGQYEIEARLGKIIDPKTHQRIMLPVRTEVALAPGMEFAFESQMTEDQHQAFNNTLNGYLEDSMKGRDGPSQRIPMRYKHTKEVDSFYELPDSELSLLPPAMQSRLRGGRVRKPKLRVTKDQKTGAVIAKIIKIKLQDMHIFDPRTEFDWRISVNAEMNWDGSISQLTPSTNSQDRRKDRMSYKHLAFQIDLTQVTSSSSAAKTHELEVELSSSEVRRQGLLAEQGQPNGYEDLIKAFADNVRVLSRRFGWV